MSTVIIAQSERFILSSSYNGIAYTLRNTAEAREVFVQGDDAAAFREELEKFEKHNPEGDALAYLWDQYEAISEGDDDAN